MVMVYKILPASLWEQAVREGAFTGAGIDIADGYIHFSTAHQVAETAAKHFAGVDGLVLVAVDTDKLGAGLKWEPARGGALFPHLYGTLAPETAAWVEAMPLVEGRHVLPGRFG